MSDENEVQYGRTSSTSTTLVEDTGVPFPAYFVRYKTKTEQRMFVAFHAIQWIRFQYKRRTLGCVMVDIDDTLIDGNENVVNGFQFMKDLYQEIQTMFPVHVVTARPDEDHGRVMKLLLSRGFCIPPDRLHMLPTEHYGKDHSYVEEFKWKKFLDIAREHNGVVARFGDKLWDVAHHSSLTSYLSHIQDKDCYVFVDPRQKGTASFKLPGLA